MDAGLIYLPVGVYWSGGIDCAGWSDLGIPDFPTILDDSENWQFPDWFGAPFPRSVVMDQNFQITYSGINHNFDQIRSAIVSAIVEIPGNEGLEPQLEFGANRAVYAETSSQNDQLYPDITVGSDGRIHVVWIETVETANDIFYSFSNDGGNSFSTPVQLNSVGGAVTLADGSGPRIRLRNEQLVAVWADHRNDENSSAIVMATSVDNGGSWEEVGIISDLGGSQLFPDIETGPDGRWHLIYYNWLPDGSFEGIRYAVTLPGESAFEPSTLPDLTSGFGTPSTCSPPDLAVNTSGDVFIAFRNNYNNFRDHFIARKPVDQYDFNVAVAMSYNWWSSEECPASGPSISVNENYIGAGYMVETPANTFLRWGSPFSLVFHDELNVNPEAADFIQDFPDVEVDREYLHAVWVSDVLGSPDIYYGYSKSYADGLFRYQRVNDDPAEESTVQTHPRLHFSDENLYAVWIDYREGPARIYFAGTLAPAQLPGDVNLDGIVDILDIIVVVNFITGTQLPDEIQAQLADLNEDGAIDILDVILLVNQIMDQS
ncbi:MAG: hypothetical protein GXO91_07065 [FCB group bacterium]|nr:hypothetical protein [FCB group bacterium]